VFAVIEFPVTDVPGAANVVMAVMSPKLFPYWS